MKLKQWFLFIILPLTYHYWLIVRGKSKNGWEEELCYCGHTYKCSCGNPDINTFKDSIKRKTIILFDKNNGWKTYED